MHAPSSIPNLRPRGIIMAEEETEMAEIEIDIAEWKKLKVGNNRQ